jgi:hypothetical protein
MSSLRDKRDTRGRLGRRVAFAAAVVSVASLAIAGTAIAGQDPLKGGSVAIQLQGSKALKLSPASLSLPITGGAVDPIDGSGSVTTTGALKAKHGGRKVKVKIIGLTFGPNGAPGSIAAKIGKKKVARFGALAGGTTTRDGWGAKIENVTATLASKGAAALNRAFNPKGGKGAKSAAKGGVRAGAPLGSVTATTVPRTVEVLPGGTTTLVTDMSLVTKLQAHCVDALTGGVTAIPPATLNLLTATFTFPNVGGTIAPDFSDGRLITAGGQLIKKKTTPLITPSACTSADPPEGTSVTQTDFETDFALNAFSAQAITPTGPLGLGAVGELHLDQGTVSIDPDTKDITVSDVPITLAFLAAQVLNTVFPNESGDPSNDFQQGDPVGTLSITAKAR